MNNNNHCDRNSYSFYRDEVMWDGRRTALGKRCKSIYWRFREALTPWSQERITRYHTISCIGCNVGFSVWGVSSGGSSLSLATEVSSSPSASISSSLKPNPNDCGILVGTVLMQWSDDRFRFHAHPSRHSRFGPAIAFALCNRGKLSSQIKKYGELWERTEPKSLYGRDNLGLVIGPVTFSSPCLN